MSKLNFLKYSTSVPNCSTLPASSTLPSAGWESYYNSSSNSLTFGRPTAPRVSINPIPLIQSTTEELYRQTPFLLPKQAGSFVTLTSCKQVFPIHSASLTTSQVRTSQGYSSSLYCSDRCLILSRMKQISTPRNVFSVGPGTNIFSAPDTSNKTPRSTRSNTKSLPAPVRASRAEC